jgi:hypothetical protein
MDLTEESETSANINQTLGKHPKVDTVNTEHSEILKSRIRILITNACFQLWCSKSFLCFVNPFKNYTLFGALHCLSFTDYISQLTSLQLMALASFTV